MTTLIRPSISKKNKYWIGKHRYYELKHFCLQYLTWKKVYASLDDGIFPSQQLNGVYTNKTEEDITGKLAVVKTRYSELIKMVEDAALETDSFLSHYILKAVTEECSYDYLKTKMNMPCSKDVYYDRYRKFFWILSNKRY